MAISEFSADAGTPAVRGENTGGGSGLFGASKSGRAVEGWSETNYGVTGDSQKFPGVRGTSVDGRGVEGWSTANDGVWGISKAATGVHGVSEEAGTGVVGESKTGRGVHGISVTWQGVYGQSQENAGVVGESTKFHAIFGAAHDPNNAGVFGTNDSEGGFGISGVSPNGIGVSGKGGKLAARFEGNVEVWGDINLTNADCAEHFDIADMTEAEPGTVMVLNEDGSLRPSSDPYDKRVAGVVAGAGSFKPGIVLDRRETGKERLPITLMGKTFCKVDASFGAVTPGDLLTTSPTPGHAMKASDPVQAFGTVIGKALGPLSSSRGLIPILVSLQ